MLQRPLLMLLVLLALSSTAYSPGTQRSTAVGAAACQVAPVYTPPEGDSLTIRMYNLERTTATFRFRVSETIGQSLGEKLAQAPPHGRWTIDVGELALGDRSHGVDEPNVGYVGYARIESGNRFTAEVTTSGQSTVLVGGK